ncbi:TonB-dependent receptor [Xanthomonas citri pv. mangiferaeindicae]|nr:TonB-dependent receptor [Xanthomonas citri pv. mangiferaeindicae]
MRPPVLAARSTSSPTPGTSPGTYLRVEAGSYGYRKQQISNGGAAGNFDWYVSLLHNSRDGYQDLTDTNGRELVANLGYRFGPRLDTRLLLRYREEELINGGTLTLAQINSGSRANPAPYGRKKGGTTLVGSKTTYVFDDDARLELGVDLNNYPLYNSWRYSTTPNLWRSTDINTSVRYLRSGDILFGRNLDTSVTWSDTRLAFGDARTHDRDSWRLLKEVRYTGSRDTVLALGGELQLDASSWLSAGVSLINIDRDVRVVQSTTANTSVYPQRYALDTWYAAPRLGLRYRLTPDLQAFANVSRSIDPPVTWQISGGGVATPFARPLVPQKATTAEAGVRGSHGIFDGSLTIYRSWINDDLLTVVTQQATASTDAVVANANAGPTVHQGIEAALSTRVWDGDDGSGLSLRQAYTLNDFHYRRDAAFAQNALPGLPRQVYQAELQYAHGSAFMRISMCAQRPAITSISPIRSGRPVTACWAPSSVTACRAGAGAPGSIYATWRTNITPLPPAPPTTCKGAIPMCSMSATVSAFLPAHRCAFECGRCLPSPMSACVRRVSEVVANVHAIR